MVISGKTVDQRLTDAQEIISLLHDELKDGSSYVEPLDQPEPSSAAVDLKAEIACKDAIVDLQ